MIKRFAWWWLAAVFLLSTVAYSQSLGDVARANRQLKKKHAARVYTEDDIPSRPPAPVTETKPGEPAEGAAATASAPEKPEGSPEGATAETDTAKPAAPKKSNEKTSADGKPSEAALRARIREQKDSISLMERELSVLEGEYRIQTTLYYKDAGARLRDTKDWVDQRKKYTDGIQAKKKELQDVRAQLEVTLEEARKAGISTTAIE